MLGRNRAEYEREQAERAEAERRAEEARAAQRTERQDAERRAERERKVQERADALLGMAPSQHLDRAARAYARNGDANGIVVELLFAIAKSAVRP